MFPDFGDKLFALKGEHSPNSRQMLVPRSHPWTPRQKAGIVIAGVVALILSCGVVYVYERDYRGPSGSVFCGTWEMPLFDDQVYLQLNPDQTFSMFGLFEGAPNPFAKGRWYAGGPNIYLRFTAENLEEADRPWVFQIIDFQPEQFRVRFVRRYSGDAQIMTFRRANLNSPSASNQPGVTSIDSGPARFAMFQTSQTPNHTMQRTATKPAIYFVTVCHPPSDYESRYLGLAVADLFSLGLYAYSPPHPCRRYRRARSFRVRGGSLPADFGRYRTSRRHEAEAGRTA